MRAEPRARHDVRPDVVKAAAKNCTHARTYLRRAVREHRRVAAPHASSSQVPRVPTVSLHSAARGDDTAIRIHGTEAFTEFYSRVREREREDETKEQD